MAGPNPPPYRISISRVEYEKLIALGKIAKEQGLRDEYIASVEEMIFRLGYEPAEWGESRRHLNALDIEMRLGQARMIDVLFGVHEQSKTVFIKECRLRRKYNA